jgi:transposase
MATTYIGVDVSKKTLNIYLPATNKAFEVTNDQQGFTTMLSTINKHYQLLSELIVVFEPTGGYEYHLREFLKINKLPFATVHPNKVRSYAKARGWLAKTDSIDSKLLHDYATCFALPVKVTYDSNSQQQLHALFKRREQLLVFKNQEVVRQDTEFNHVIILSLNQHIASLTEQLQEIEDSIKELISQAQEIKDKIDWLTSIPAVGITLASTIICEAPELGNIIFRQLTSLIGLAPFARESGSYKGRRSIFAGRGNLRRVLYMAVVAALRCNKHLRNFYDRLILISFG